VCIRLWGCRVSWRVDALCRNADPNLYDVDWIGETWGIRSAARRDEYAKQMCAGCPVIRECARDALEHVDMGFVAGCGRGEPDVVGTMGVIRGGVAVGRHGLLSRRLRRLALVAGVPVPKPVARVALVCFGCGRGFGVVVRGSSRLCSGCVGVKESAA